MENLNKIGIGTMNFSRDSQADAVKLIHAAAEQQPILLDTADFYGSGASEMIIGEALRTMPREKVQIIAKFGALKKPSGDIYGLDMHPSRINNYLAQTMQRLGTDYIDVYMPSRMDMAIPVEDVMLEVVKLKDAGYIGGIGLSQVDVDTLRRAQAVHPLAYVESNYSLFNREIEADILPWAAENQVRIAAFGVLAHGLLTGADKSGHYMSLLEQFRAGNLEINLALVEKLKAIAERKNIDLPTLATAWMLHKGDHIYPVIGMRRIERFQAACQALQVSLSPDEMQEIESIMQPENVAGKAFPEMKFKNGELFRG